MLQEKVMDSLKCLAYSDVGQWAVQTVIKLGHPSPSYITSWLESNMQKTLLDRRTVYVAITLVQQLLARSRKAVQDA